MTNITRILSTVSLSDSLIDKAGARGIALTAIPFINIEQKSDDQTTKHIRQLVAEPTTVVFTSANAVQAVVAVLKGAQPNWTVYCIGHATQKAVSQYFQVAGIKGIGDDALSLSKVMIADGVREFTFFCGDKRLDILPNEAKANNMLMHELVVYHTEERPVAVESDYDGILFFSPSAVDSFFSMNNVADSTVMFAIGNTTAAAIKARTGNKLIVGTAPAKEQVLDEAIKYFQQASMIAAK